VGRRKSDDIEEKFYKFVCRKGAKYSLNSPSNAKLVRKGRERPQGEEKQVDNPRESWTRKRGEGESCAQPEIRNARLRSAGEIRKKRNVILKSMQEKDGREAKGVNNQELGFR